MVGLPPSNRNGSPGPRRRLTGVPLELPLTGGRITIGVVRVGDEVRRPVGSHSSFAQQVLRLLELAGFDGAPRFIGIDEQGRERLSYLPGWVPSDLDQGAWRDEQLVAATDLLRGVHDALAGSQLAGQQETICHNDLGPCNTVHATDGVPYAFIDWDTAAPGPRINDLAHAIWRWAIVSDTDELPLDEQIRRVGLMNEVYGRFDTANLLDAISVAQQHVIAHAEQRGDRAASCWHRGERDWFNAHRDRFARHAVNRRT
jgi:aminoglycoside phosphotransferase (APT) family kinase protein